MATLRVGMFRNPHSDLVLVILGSPPINALSHVSIKMQETLTCISIKFAQCYDKNIYKAKKWLKK